MTTSTPPQPDTADRLKNSTTCVDVNEEIDLPRRFQSVARLTMRGRTSSTPSNINPHAYVCVGFRDHIVQRMEFDNHENHEKNWSDTDDCAC